MNTRTAVAAFTVGVGAVFAASYGVGAAVGPIATTAVHSEGHGVSTDETVNGDKNDTRTHGGDHAGAGADPAAAPASADIPGGLMVSQNGYGLDLRRDVTGPGRDQIVEFTVTGHDGEPVTRFDIEHEKRLHLIAVKRDFSGFQHVHPTMDERGTWSIPLDLDAGQWRLFADFTPTGGEATTLGADMLVEGTVKARPEKPHTRVAQVDGYTVTLDGDLSAGSDAKLTLSVSRDGAPVTDLEPYLGAYGHVVALREGDLAYLHVHPDGTPDDGRTKPGPDVVFYAAVPSAGDYHLYLDFKHSGVVRTATFHLGTGSQTPSGSSENPTEGQTSSDRPHDDSSDEEHSH